VSREPARYKLIKSEGFSFLQLTGGYAQFKTHQDAQKLFAQHVEDLIRHEIKDYVVAVTPRAPEDAPGGTGPSGRKSGA
jgi:hypothetical protein